MSGFIGQYVHGNEPSPHIIYFYTMLGQPWKTADHVRQVLNTLYDDTPDGLCGNEDVGQMSAWYILSALGIYQVEPAGGRYYFGSPIIDGATLRVADGTFKITVKNNSDRNRYIQSIRLNGKRHRKPYIDYADLAGGGTLQITMGSKPTRWW
jgi:predicted alpha-1,2-mannosidase